MALLSFHSESLQAACMRLQILPCWSGLAMSFILSSALAHLLCTGLSPLSSETPLGSDPPPLESL